MSRYYRTILATLGDNAFTMLIKTDNAGSSASNQFTIPTTGVGYNYDVDWGDGTKSIGITGNTTKTYAGAGTYVVKIKGLFPRINFNNTGDRLKLLEILQWGIYGTSLNQTAAFYGCSNLTYLPDDIEFINSVTNGTNMFRGINLTSLPSTMTLNSLTNGFFMFNGSSLTSLPSGMLLSSLDTGQNMFDGNNLTSLPSAMTLPLLFNGITMFRNNNLTSLPSGMILSTLSTASSMFQNNSLTSLPSSMTLSALSLATDFFNGNSLTDLPSGIKLQSLTSGSRMFVSNTINTVRYSQLLVDLESDNPNNSVTFGGGLSKYNTTGQIARNILTSPPRNWIITDGGLQL
jgi:hypothetical protein